MPHKKIPKPPFGRFSLEKILSRTYLVKRGYFVGRFNVGSAATGKKIKLKLITFGSEDETSNRRLSMDEALKRKYSVFRIGKTAGAHVPLVLVGSRVNIYFVD